MRLDALDSVMMTHYVAVVTECADQKCEGAVLAGLLRDCDAVLATIEEDDTDEAEKLRDLRTALAYALDP